MSNFKTLFKELETQIQQSYTEGVTIDEAEKLAGKCLHAQILVSRELKESDLNSRMRKTGLKAVRAVVYLDIVNKSEKKPTESGLEHMLNSNFLVGKEQDELDLSESNRDELERYYSVLREAHVYFRTVCRGRFE